VESDYRRVVRSNEDYLERHGEGYRGVGWPNRHDTETRYRVMLDLIPGLPGAEPSLMDLRCVSAHLHECVVGLPRRLIRCCGSDLSGKFKELC
jgi:hypothetical protein